MTVLFALPAKADPIEDQAWKLEKAGEALFLAGKYQDALEQFQEVIRRYSKPDDVIRTARWNIARCYEELGNDTAALKAFVEYARWAKTAEEKQDLAAKLKDVRARLAAKVRFIVQPSGAEIRVDGKTIGRAPLTDPVDLAPGRHVVLVTKSGFRPHEENLEVKPKEDRTAQVSLDPLRGSIQVTAKGGKVPNAVVFVDGLEKYRGVLPTTVEVSPGNRRVVVKVPGSRHRVDEVVKVPDGGNVAVVLAVHPSPPKTGALPAKKSEKKESAVGGQVALTLGEGFLRDGGTTYRTNVTLEALGGIRFDAVPWLQTELALLISVESPVMVILRPGLRFYTGDIPIFFRLAAQVMVTPSASGGILLGAGGEIPLGKGWSLPLGIDINLWPSAISLVPVEFRLGVAYAF